MSKGISRLKLAVLTAIVGLLVALFLNRILSLMRDVERVSLIQSEAQMKSALGLELSRLAVHGQIRSIGDLAGINPIQLMQAAPSHYLGETIDPDLSSLPDGVWIFDKSKKVLIYTIRHSKYFQSGLAGRARVEYRVELDYRDRNANGRYDFKEDQLIAVNLASQGEYHWLSDRD